MLSAPAKAVLHSGVNDAYVGVASASYQQRRRAGDGQWARSRSVRPRCLAALAHLAAPVPRADVEQPDVERPRRAAIVSSSVKGLKQQASAGGAHSIGTGDVQTTDGLHLYTKGRRRQRQWPDSAGEDAGRWFTGRFPFRPSCSTARNSSTVADQADVLAEWDVNGNESESGHSWRWWSGAAVERPTDRAAWCHDGGSSTDHRLTVESKARRRAGTALV